jgi:hypothetical protein
MRELSRQEITVAQRMRDDLGDPAPRNLRGEIRAVCTKLPLGQKIINYVF